MKLDEGFLIRDIAGEDVLVPIGSKVIDFKGLITLTPVGGFIYRLLGDKKSQDEIVDTIIREYDVCRETAESDLAEFLVSLREQGVLTDE